ncbi:MAG: hypothetical protein EOP85_21895, partial [Verrucomicrobiaceae bacterium]
GPARRRARLAAITTMLSFERTLYFVLVRDAPADLPEVIDVLTAQWHALLVGNVLTREYTESPGRHTDSH